MHMVYGRLEMIQSKIEQCKRFLYGIESGEHPAFLKEESEKDLFYWQSELNKLHSN
ncbi:hypothetical protein [Paenibacillus chitinolyticus]|uniref:hypothetical protein n=1 Tax=Paenibacillus chitinolyticus TaxID=79263 RepID=UPI00366F5A01